MNTRTLLVGSILFVNLLGVSVGAKVEPTTAPASRVELPSFGLSVPTPPGYVRDADSMSSAIIFVPANQLGLAPDRVLMLDVQPKSSKETLDQIVRQTEESDQMKASPDAVNWGDRPARELVATKKSTNDLSPRRVIVLENNGCFYRLVFLADQKNANGLEGYEQLVKATSWQPIQPAGHGVAPRGPSLSLPTGIVVSVPDPFRPDMTSKSKHVSKFLAVDLLAAKPVARLMILPFVEKDPARTLDTTKAELDQNLRPAWKISGPLQWQDQPGNPRISVATRARGEDRWVEAMIVLLPDGRATVFTLQYDASPTTEGMQRTLGLVKDTIRIADR